MERRVAFSLVFINLQTSSSRNITNQNIVAHLQSFHATVALTGADYTVDQV